MLLGFGCDHVWELKRERFVPPPSDIPKIENVSEYMIQKVVFGFTKQVWMCTKCGKSRTEELIGDAR